MHFSSSSGMGPSAAGVEALATELGVREQAGSSAISGTWPLVRHVRRLSPLVGERGNARRRDRSAGERMPCRGDGRRRHRDRRAPRQYPASSRPIGDTTRWPPTSTPRLPTCPRALAWAGGVARRGREIRLGDHGGRRRCSLPEAARRLVRILHIHKITGISGSERHLLSLLPALRERGVDARFLGLDVPGTDAARFYAELAAVGRPVRAGALHVRPESADGRRGRQSRPPRRARPAPHATSCTETSTARSLRLRRASRSSPRATTTIGTCWARSATSTGFSPAGTQDHRDLGRGARIPGTSRAPAGQARHGALRARQPSAGSHPR